MCIFCAAIPMVASVGTAVTVQQRDKRREAKAHGEIVHAKLPHGKITMVVVGGLVVSAAVYHTVLMPHIGV
jgi:hypothetical protein